MGEVKPREAILSGGGMQERRIFPEQLRKLHIGIVVVTVVLIAVLLSLSWIVRVLFPEEVYFWVMVWVMVLFQYAGLAVETAYIVRSCKSSARPVVPGKTHFEARVLHPATLPLIILLVLMSFMSLTAPVISLLEGNYDHLQLLVSGLVWPGFIIYWALRASRLRISLEENGLVLRDGLLSSTPAKFYPFDDLTYLNVEGRTLVFRGKTRLVWGKYVVRDPGELRAALRKVHPG